MTPQEGSWCVQLPPAQLTSSPMAQAAVSISIAHRAPAPKLSSLPSCPGIEKHPQTHPCAKKHLPGLLHHSRQREGGDSPPLKEDLWEGPVLVLQDGRALSADRAATSVSPRHLSHRSGRLDRHYQSLSES